MEEKMTKIITKKRVKNNQGEIKEGIVSNEIERHLTARSQELKRLKKIMTDCVPGMSVVT